MVLDGRSGAYYWDVTRRPFGDLAVPDPISIPTYRSRGEPTPPIGVLPQAEAGPGAQHRAERYLASAEPHAAFLGRGTPRVQLTFLLCRRRVDVQHERVDAASECSNDERHPFLHQCRNERYVAAQATELRYSNRSLGLLRGLQRCSQLRPAAQRIGALGRCGAS